MAKKLKNLQTHPIYCINLKSEIARRERIQNRAHELGLIIDFIEGLTPNDPQTISHIKHHDIEKRKKIYNTKITPAEHSCFASHIKVLKVFLASHHAQCIILEDNVELLGNFPDFISEFQKQAVEYDVLRLETRKKCKIDFPYRELENFKLNFTPCASLGASALLFSREGAQKLLDSIDGYIYAYDTHIGNFWRYGLKTICVAPHVACRAESESVPSVIDAMDKKEKLTTRNAINRHSSLVQLIRRRYERLRHSMLKYSTAAWWCLKSRFGR